jgi:uncharacterized protein
MKAVFHIDWDEEERLLMALNNIKDMLRDVPADEPSMIVVAVGPAVNLFRKDRAAHYISTIEEVHKAGTRFLICRASLTTPGLALEDLIASCERVPTGITEIIRLQHDGYAYVKP